MDIESTIYYDSYAGYSTGIDPSICFVVKFIQ